MHFDNIDGFPAFKKIIRDKLDEREKRPMDAPGYRKASVMILFMEKNNSPHVLLTRRTDRVSTHKGQVSFPGGGHDNTDRDNLATALRETMEEVGISPEKIEVLGEFDEYISVAGFHVYVFVGALNEVLNYKVNKDEIDEILEVPFSLFYDEKYTSCEKITFDGRDYDIFYYHYGTNTIWGMTARILTDFGRKIFKSHTVQVNY
jgi:8-oxo-dGTP pyrophosphatase MutT (NUDIX family)